MARVPDLQPADEQILEYLRERPPDYVPLVASRLGLPLGYAERRFEVLTEADLLERVTREPVYRTTERGERRLADAGHQVRATDD